MGSSIIAFAFTHFLAVSDALNLADANEYALSLEPSAMYQVAKTIVPPFVEFPATLSMLRNLREGGYVLYLHHGTTNNTTPDRRPDVNLNDCKTQRPLNEEGKQLMATVGSSLRQARIPIGELPVSPMCTTLESTTKAFPGMAPVVDHDLMYMANFTEEDKIPMINNTRQLLSTPVTAKKNRVILAHAPNLMELIGYFPKEGSLVIFRPKAEGSGIEYVGSIAPSAWSGLLK